MKRAPQNTERKIVINKIFELIRKKPDLIFNFDGQTVSDNDEKLGQSRAEEFAQAVVERLIRTDISANLLKDHPWGENKQKITPCRKIIFNVYQN